MRTHQLRNTNKAQQRDNNRNKGGFVSQFETAPIYDVFECIQYLFFFFVFCAGVDSVWERKEREREREKREREKRENNVIQARQISFALP
jgi:hypothetical protein